jgi:hypothetical protein
MQSCSTSRGDAVARRANEFVGESPRCTGTAFPDVTEQCPALVVVLSVRFSDLRRGIHLLFIASAAVAVGSSAEEIRARSLQEVWSCHPHRPVSNGSGRSEVSVGSDDRLGLDQWFPRHAGTLVGNVSS